MAESTPATAEVAPIPEQDDIQRAEAFTRERFVHDGEDAAVALARGTARRRALDAALRELGEGAKVPSTKWRRRYALLLGLERLLSEDEPRLADGTTLNPHQVDALSGTLTALLAAAQNGSGAPAPSAAPVLAIEEEEQPEPEPEQPHDEAEPDEDEDDDEEDEDLVEDEEEPVAAAPPDEEEDEDDEDEEEDEDEEDEEPELEDSWDDDEEDVDEDLDAAAAEDPNAHKRFWFEHATGAGKTVAAMGFVEASRTGGILILTHRRNLVDQFLGELRTRGYAKRESPPLLLDEDGKDRADGKVGPVTVETYQWFVRNAGRISDAYTIVICDEAHTALGEKTSAAIRQWTGPIFIGMTATGALIAR
ncbi:MAG: DEAD/DEAH box helicase, partial [Solirubrobacteraceae bacterium]